MSTRLPGRPDVAVVGGAIALIYALRPWEAPRGCSGAPHGPTVPESMNDGPHECNIVTNVTSARESELEVVYVELVRLSRRRCVATYDSMPSATTFSLVASLYEATARW